MSFLRHTQIYRPMVWIFQAGRLSTVPPSSSDESAPGYSWRVALLHCSLPLHQATAIVKPLAGNRQPPLAAGWGIFNWRNGEFSLGVDTRRGSDAFRVGGGLIYGCLRWDSGRGNNPRTLERRRSVRELCFEVLVSIGRRCKKGNGLVSKRRCAPSGTLLIPQQTKPSPAIIFVQGAGPDARSASQFLAQDFATHGVAALIYDKRGAGASTGDWKHASFEDLAGDVQAAIGFLKRRPDINPHQIGLMGSSQGGWIAPIRPFS